LAPEPNTLLFDEPLTNIDHSLREGLLGLISETLRTSKSRMVYVTHDEHEARTLADTIIRLENGRIVGTEKQEIHR
jgi:iron(III) transport system ATP-binding protein